MGGVESTAAGSESPWASAGAAGGHGHLPGWTEPILPSLRPSAGLSSAVAPQTTAFSSRLEVKPGTQVCVVRAEASSLSSPQTAAALPPSPTPGLWAWSPGVQAGGRTSRPCFPARAGLGQDHSREGGGGPGLNKQAAGRHSHLGRNHTGLSFSRWEHLHGGGPVQAGPEGWVSRPRAGSWGGEGLHAAAPLYPSAGFLSCFRAGQMSLGKTLILLLFFYVQ